MTKRIIQAMLGALFMVGAIGTAHAAETTFEDWTVSCDEGGSCFAQMQSLGPRVIVGWNSTENKVRLGVVVTAKARVGQPVTVRLDNNTMIYLSVNSCTQNYCEAMAQLDDTDKIVTRMQSAATGVASYLEVTATAADGDAPARETAALQIAPLSFAGFADAVAMVKGQSE